MVALAYSYIRFSSLEQAKGNSLERQTDKRDQYLARKGLVLDSTFVIPTACGSAFHGANAVTGALKAFLDGCEKGPIRRGSYLIIENLDRLSRDKTPDAVRLFLCILQHGITIVTLEPELEFNEASLDMTKLIWAVVELARGHGESLIKSARSRHNWEVRRKNIASSILTCRKPSWLDIVESKFVLNPAKAVVVRRIFDLTVGGYGIGSIAKLLNRDEVAPIGKSKHWHDSYVHKILANRACIGDFQPRTLHVEREEAGSGQPRPPRMAYLPAGPAIKGYFPAVVGDDVFFKAQQALRLRSNTGGRVSSGVNNLFTRLVVDEEGVTHSLRPRNSHDYLVRATVTAGLEQDRPAVPYAPFERVMLKWLRELSITVEDGGGDIEALRAKKEDIEHRIATLKARLKTTPHLESVLDVLAELEADNRQVTQELELASIPKADHLARAKDLIGLLEAAEDKEPLRRQIKQQILLLVEKIVVRVEGKPRTKTKRVYCEVRFKNGLVRGVWFQTGSQPDDGLWSPDGRFRADDMTALLRDAAEAAGIDTGKGPPPMSDADIARMEDSRQVLESLGADLSNSEFVGGGWITPHRRPEKAVEGAAGGAG